MTTGADEADGVPGAGALVVRAGGSGGPAAAGPKPLAGFLAQLLACREGAPAYRARRRAEPQAALASYASGAACPASRFERVL